MSEAGQVPDKRLFEILVVDDEEQNRYLLRVLCEHLGYTVREAVNGQAALDAVASQPPDLVILDVTMPVMDGFTALRALKADAQTAHIPVIILTALDSHEDRLRGIAAGANDFLNKPVAQDELTLLLRNNLHLKEYEDFLQHHARLLEKQVAARTAQLQAAHAALQHAYRETIARLTRAGECRDPETGAHIRRTGEYCRILAEALGKSPDFAAMIACVAPMHDIGKVGVPDSVLLKHGPLSDGEWQVMRRHPEQGFAILQGGDEPSLAMAAEIALGHHEHWDGSGYPRGLCGEQIPLAARIMLLADVYDALRSRRPYKEPLPHAEAVHIILAGDGRVRPEHFDPRLLAAFRACHERFAVAFAAESAPA